MDLYCRASSLPVPVTLREKEQEGGESSGQTTSRDVDGEEERHLDAVLALLHKLDNAYHTLTLNHVARRASRAQGIALLTLYSKAFSGPSPIRLPHTSTASRRNAFDLEPESEQALDQREGDQERYRTRAAKLVDALKLRIRRGEHHGHLPICWATFSASLGLSKRV